MIVDPLKDFGRNDPNSPDLNVTLGKLRDMCREVSCTPIISVHTTKSQREKDGLSQMAGTAPAAWAGNYLSLSRHGMYQQNHKHELYLEYGGRAGQTGKSAFLYNDLDHTFHFLDAGAKFAAHSKNDVGYKAAKDEEIKQKIIKWFDHNAQKCIAASGITKAIGPGAGEDRVVKACKALEREGYLHARMVKHAGKDCLQYTKA